MSEAEAEPMNCKPILILAVRIDDREALRRTRAAAGGELDRAVGADLVEGYVIKMLSNSARAADRPPVENRW